MQLVALLFIMPLLAAPAPTGASPSPIKDGWAALLASNCDLKAQHVNTPLEARALRNVPYALRGKQLKSAELTELYTADGGWYKPQADAKAKFNKPTWTCIKKLRNHEAALRERLKWPLNKVERRITGNHKVVSELRNNKVERLIRRDVFRAKDETTWHLIDSCGKDDAGKPMCNGPQVICTAERCFMFYPG